MVRSCYKANILPFCPIQPFKMSDPSIAEHFSQYFEISIANTPELKQEGFSIRYQVYCKELGYEPVEKFPDGCERDVYDDRSIHYLIKHRPTGDYAGCVRVVLPDLQSPEAVFPLESVFPKHFSLVGRPRHEFVEISRLAVLSKFRRRKGESQSPQGQLVFSEEDKQNSIYADKRRFPVIALSLYWTCFCIAVSLKQDIFALMELRLARHLKRTGIISHRIGDLAEYRGKRGFFVIKPLEFIDLLAPDIQELMQKIDAHVKIDLSNQPEITRHFNPNLTKLSS